MVKVMKKIMIASDIHGSAYYCEKMLECYKNEKADMLVLFRGHSLSWPEK